MRRLLVPALAISMLVPSASKADPPVEHREIAARVSALARIDALDDSVLRPLDVAKQALARAARDEAAGRPDAVARDVALAHAAVTLAEARLRLVRERALYQAAAARRRAGEADRARADAALAREQARTAALQTKAGEAP